MKQPSYWGASLSKLKRDDLVKMIDEAAENGDLTGGANTQSIKAMIALLQDASQNAGNRMHAQRGKRERPIFSGITASECNAFLATLPEWGQ